MGRLISCSKGDPIYVRLQCKVVLRGEKEKKGRGGRWCEGGETVAGT